MTFFQQRARTQVPIVAAQLSNVGPSMSRLVRSMTQPVVSQWIELVYALEALNPRGENVVLQFLGAGAGVGTSTVACGFARAAGHAAASGLRMDGSQSAPTILYVDCSPRAKPRRKAAGRDGEVEGLMSMLREGRSLSDAVLAVPDAEGVQWSWLGNRESGENSAFSSREMGHLLSMLRERYSMVVLDSPPISEGVSALAVTRHCDGTVLVLRAEKTPARTVHEVQDAIERVGGQVVGTVFNRVRRHAGWRSSYTTG